MTHLVVISAEDIETIVRKAVREEIAASKPCEVWLTVPQVAKRLNKSEKTIRNWIQGGRFTRVSGGGGTPYLISSLEVDEMSRSASSSPDVS